MFNVIILSPKATKDKNGFWGPYISVSAISTRGTWRVLDMLPVASAISMVHFREGLK